LATLFDLALADFFEAVRAGFFGADGFAPDLAGAFLSVSTARRLAVFFAASLFRSVG
jgi:hypothetical protein